MVSPLVWSLMQGYRHSLESSLSSSSFSFSLSLVPPWGVDFASSPELGRKEEMGWTWVSLSLTVWVWPVWNTHTAEGKVFLRYSRQNQTGERPAKAAAPAASLHATTILAVFNAVRGDRRGGVASGALLMVCKGGEREYKGEREGRRGKGANFAQQ